MNRLAILLLPLVFLATSAVRAASEDTDYRRAHHLYTLHEYKMAVEALNKYIADYPKSERAEQARLLLGESLYQLKDYAQAAQHFDKYIAEFPSSARRPDALQRAVKIHWQTKNYARSIECADAFLKENKDRLGKPDAPALKTQFESVLFYAGDASYGLKKPDQARSYWERLQAEFPESALIPDAAEGLGWVAFDGGKFDQALKQFSLTAAAPKHAKAASSNLMAARAQDQLGRPDEALALLDKTAALTGGRELARETTMWRAIFLLKAKRPADAVAAYKALVKDYADHAETPAAVLQAVVQAEEQNKDAECLELCDLYLSSFPKAAERAPVARVKVRALASLKKNDAILPAAQAALKEAEALAPGTPAYNDNRPAALMLLAEYSQANGQAFYEKILKDHAASRYAPPARYQLAYLHAQAQKLPEALSHAEALLKELPEAKALPDAERADLQRKALFAAGDFAFRLNQREQAEKHLKAYSELPAVKADPAAMQMGLVLLRLAWCRHGAGDFAAALPLLDQALATKPAPELQQEMLYLRGRARVDESAKNPAGDAAAGDKALADYAQLLKDAPNATFSAHACFDAAQLLYKSKPADAAVWLDKLLENPAFTQPGNTGVDAGLLRDGRMLRARLRYTLGKGAEALADAETLLKDTTLKKDTLAAATFLKAVCLEALPGKEADAEAAYGALAAITGNDLTADTQSTIRIGLLRRAKLRFNAKKFQEAQADLAQFIGNRELKSEDAAEIEASVLLAICKKELKDTAGAQAVFDQLGKLTLTGPAAFEIPFQIGNLAYEAGKYPDAAVQYRKALDLAAAGGKKIDLPLTALSAAWLNLAWSSKRAGENAKAEAAFAELLKLDPTGPYSAEARYHRGRILAESGDLAAALALWKELLDKQPAHELAEQALAATGEFQAKSSRFPEALKSFEQYLEKYPNGASIREVWCGVGECRLQARNFPGAREAFMKALGEKGLEADLDEVGERALLGIAETALGKGEAAETKKQALRIILDRPESKWLDSALYLCGRASEDMGEPNQAIGYYRKLLDERPKSERAETAKERLKALGAPAVEKK